MKTALVFSGQPRYIRECQESITKNVLDIIKPDIYAHFWWDDSYIGQKFKFHAADTYEENGIDLFNQFYSPNQLVFEPQQDFDMSFYNFHNNEVARDVGENSSFWAKEVAFKLTSAMESTRRASLLVQSDYDIIIRIRTDLLFNQSVRINHLNLKFNHIYFDEFENQQHFADWFFLGDNDSMKKFLSIGEQKIWELSNKTVRHAHSIFHLGLNHYNLSYSKMNFGSYIYRNYKRPVKMSEYTNPSLIPHWYK